MTPMRADAESQLAHIRAICEEVLTANPDDSTVQLVDRMRWLAWPETAAKGWFRRWQAATDEIDRLRAAIDRVRTLHHPSKRPEDSPPDGACVECSLLAMPDSVGHPCPTIRVLDWIER